MYGSEKVKFVLSVHSIKPPLLGVKLPFKHQHDQDF